MQMTFWLKWWVSSSRIMEYRQKLTICNLVWRSLLTWKLMLIHCWFFVSMWWMILCWWQRFHWCQVQWRRSRKSSNRSKVIVFKSKWRKCTCKGGFNKNWRETSIIKSLCPLLRKESFKKTERSEENRKRSSLLLCNQKSKKQSLLTLTQALVNR